VSTPSTDPPPSFAGPEGTSRYGPSFWVCVCVGWAAIAFGLWSLLSRPEATHPPAVAAWLVGLALAHDLVLAPAVLLVAWLLRRVAPRIALGLVLGALAISAIVALYAFPLVQRYGAQPDNPSFLPRDVGAGLLLVIAVVWVVAAGSFLRRLGRRGPA
jgi:hypothetical protein